MKIVFTKCKRKMKKQTFKLKNYGPKVLGDLYTTAASQIIEKNINKNVEIWKYWISRNATKEYLKLY